MDTSPKLTDEIKARIDAMTRIEMAGLWRFTPAGSSIYFQGEVGLYFETRFKELGGFTPSISKALGW